MFSSVHATKMMNFVNWCFLVNQKHVVQYSLITKQLTLMSQ